MVSPRLILLSYCLSYLRQSHATCYQPNGTAITDPAFQPCNQVEGSFSQCCGTNHSKATTNIDPDICLPNGLCQNTGDSLYWRGSCTDKTWKSPLCLSNLCADSKNGGSSKKNVPVGQCSDGTWCCGGVNVTCCQLKLGVSLAATIGQSTVTSTPVTISSTSQSSTSSKTVSPTNTTNPSTGMSSGEKIGIGIGVAGAVLAVVIVAVTVLLWKKRRTRAKELEPLTPGYVGVSYHELKGSTKSIPVEISTNVPLAELPESPRNRFRAELPSH